ncbi:hypothetical protein [Nitratidesulfovibrio sp.]|uniref:hypothetical protein n=1 Tax=Nitratidesulfovibrio sp. TaxID=2802297 RepID=UPI003342C556
MNRKTLRKILEPRPDEADAPRWQAAVPLVTNPFLLIEVAQFALVGGSVVLISLCVGLFWTDGGLTLPDLVIAVQAALATAVAIVIGFAAIAVLFFDNRYFALYQMDSGGIYHEGTRGHSEGDTVLCRNVLPYPVAGAVRARRTRSRYLPWEKVRSFQSVPSLRVIILRRGFWHMLHLYMPSAETHETVARYLATRLKNAG